MTHLGASQGATLGKSLGQVVLVAGLLSMLGGCKFFDISNPLIPTARLIGEATPSMADVKYVYKLSDGTVTVTVKESQVTISSYPGDGTPGVFINSYSAEYLDQSNKTIPTITLSKVNFGVSAYVPPANNGKQSSITMTLPIYNQQVQEYGYDQVYNFTPNAGLNRTLIHTINCSVTLYGQDDNFNQVQIPVSVPIRFAGDISQ